MHERTREIGRTKLGANIGDLLGDEGDWVQYFVWRSQPGGPPVDARCTHHCPTGAVSPMVSQYMPGEQGTQSLLKVMPLVLEKVPMGHGTGADTAVGLRGA